jgi:hypothetical protein
VQAEGEEAAEAALAPAWAFIDASLHKQVRLGGCWKLQLCN